MKTSSRVLGGASALACGALLASACHVVEAKAYNLDELHDSTGRHKYTAALVGDIEYLIRMGLVGALRGFGSDAARKSPVAVEDPTEACLENLTRGIDDEKALAARAKEVVSLFGKLASQIERELILDGTRVDGRRFDEIRPITIVPNFIKRHHGSVLFTRGETQALVSCTLGTPDDEQIIDGIEEEYKKRFYLHYTFPPFSVGETRQKVPPAIRPSVRSTYDRRTTASHAPAPPSAKVRSGITFPNEPPLVGAYVRLARPMIRETNTSPP